MRLPVTAVAAISLLLLPLAADAKPKPGRGHGNGHAARSESGFCPPGLRDRNPACVPPGQARQAARRDEVRRVVPVPVAVAAEPEEGGEPSEEWAAGVAESVERGEALLAAATILDVLRDAPARPETLATALAQPAAWTPEPVVVPSPGPALIELPATWEPEATASEPIPAAEASLRPLPAPSEEGPLTDVFRRAAEVGSTGY